MSVTASDVELDPWLSGLIDRSRGGDHSAFSTLVRALEGSVQSFLRQMTNDHDVATDLCQETFLRAYCALPRFRPEARLRPWLYRIARNLAIDYLRERKSSFGRRDFDAHVEGLASGGDSPEDSLAQRRRVGALEEAVADLRPSYREALLLFALDGLQYEEMSERTGASVAALKSRVVRGRLELRRALGLGHHAEGEPVGGASFQSPARLACPPPH